MKVGDLVYDVHFDEHGLIVAVTECGDWFSVLYEDGQLVGGISGGEATIEVINENR